MKDDARVRTAADSQKTGLLEGGMRIGVVSDTHDRGEAVAEALRLLAEQRVELILHCGDIESPETVLLFRDVPTHFVFGNWDKDRPRLSEAIKSIGGHHNESFGAIVLGGKRVAWVHSHERHQLYQLEHSDYFDYIFYGHTHVREQHKTGRTVVANPGALFRANPKTCIVLDTDTGEIKPIMIATPGKLGESTHVLPGLRGGSVIGMAGMPPVAPAVPPTVDPPGEPSAQ